MSELKQFKLPDVGEGLTEADIVKWHVQPGDKIAINQIIVEIETAKAVVELPSPYEGVVAGLLVPEGETADVGTPIISVEVGPDAGSEQPPAPAGRKPAAPTGSTPAPGDLPVAPSGSTAADLVPPLPEGGSEPGIHGTLAPKEDERQAVLVGYGVKPGSTRRRPRKAATAGATGAAAVRAAPAASSAPDTRSPRSGAPDTPARGAASAAPGRAAAAVAPAPASSTPGGPATSGNGASVLAKPPVRKLAKDLGIDLSRLSGTGPGGSITRDDVQSAAQAEDTAEPADAAALPEFAPVTAVAREERIPIRGVRKHTAAAMAGSAFTAPHVTEFLQIDVTETMAATARLRALPEFAGVRVSPLVLVARALMVAVARHPMINSTWDEDSQEIVVRHYVNLGIAAATDRGLVVPEHQGCARAVAARSRPRARRARRDRQGRQGHTGRPARWHDHDHERRRLRRGHRNTDSHSGSSGYPRVRAGQRCAVGSPGPARGAQGHDPGPLVRPSHRRRRPRLGRAARHRRDAGGPAADARLVLTPSLARYRRDRND